MGRFTGCRVVPIATIAVFALSTASGCASRSGSAAPVVHGTTSSALAGSSAVSAPVGSAAASPQQSNAAPFVEDSGGLLIAQSTIPTVYQVYITVTITAHTDASAPASSTATGYEVAFVTIVGHAGSFDYTDQDFRYLSTHGGPYLPIAGGLPERFGKDLGSGTVVAGQTVQGYVVFRVPVGGGQVQLYGSLGPQGGWRSPA